MKKGALFCLKGFIREPKPTKKGIRVLLGILEPSESPNSKPKAARSRGFWGPFLLCRLALRQGQEAQQERPAKHIQKTTNRLTAGMVQSLCVYRACWNPALGFRPSKSRGQVLQMTRPSASTSQMPLEIGEVWDINGTLVHVLVDHRSRKR